MRVTNDNNSNTTIIIHHFGRLAVIIFALAMALTVLGFELPESTRSMTNAEINNFLMAQLEPLSAYVLTFLLITFYYWIEHAQQFKYMESIKYEC